MRAWTLHRPQKRTGWRKRRRPWRNYFLWWRSLFTRKANCKWVCKTCLFNLFKLFTDFPQYLPFNPDHFGEMNIHFSFYPRILWAPLKRREFYGSFFYGSWFFAFLCFRTSSRCTCKYIRKHRKFNFVPICIQISLPHVHLLNEFLGFIFFFFFKSPIFFSSRSAYCMHCKYFVTTTVFQKVWSIMKFSKLECLFCTS